MLALAVAGCAQVYQPMGLPRHPPALAGDAVVAADGYRLPMRAWLPDGEPAAVILGLHGFNDYSNMFEGAGPVWAAHGIATHAYDQRGFGRSRGRGIWPGADTLVDDLRAAAALLRGRHPGVPLYLLGHSMGGAVVIAALGGTDPPPVDGVVLVAPAAWGRDGMTVIERLALWLAVAVTPGMTLTGEALDIVPSDNIEMLIALGRDPLVIKETRTDAIGGLVDLMDAGRAAAPWLRVPTLVLFGDNEEVLPPESVDALLARLPSAGRRVAFYPDGYHMLLRDLHARVVIDDIAAWVLNPAGPLPSGHDGRARGEGDVVRR